MQTISKALGIAGVVLTLTSGMAVASRHANAAEPTLASAASSLFYNFPVAPFALVKGSRTDPGVLVTYSAALSEQPSDQGNVLVLSARSFYYGDHSAFGYSFDFNLHTGVIQAASMSPENNEPTPPGWGRYLTPPTSGAGYFEYLRAVRKSREDLVGSHAPAQAVAYLEQVEKVVARLPGIYAAEDNGERGYATSATPISFSAIAASDCDALVDILTTDNTWVTGTRVAVRGGEVRNLRPTLDLSQVPEGSYKLSIKLVPTGRDWTAKLSEATSDYYVLIKR